MDITTNPWIINAADVTAGSLVVWPYRVHVRQIIFFGYINTNDKAIVNQNNGKFFAELTAASDLESVRTNNVEWASGIVIPQLGISNGSLAIYIR